MILYFIFGFLSFLNDGPLWPSPGADKSLYGIFVKKKTINCLTVSKLYEDPVLPNGVVCYTRIFVCQISNTADAEKNCNFCAGKSSQ